MKKILLTGLTLALLACPAIAAEKKKDTRYADIQPDAVTTSDRAVWGAIAYSPSTGKNGIFYGAPSRDEATRTAVKYCRHAADQKDDRGDCSLAVIMYNDWDDRRIGRKTTEANRAPHCGAVAAADHGPYAAMRGPTLKEARESALAACSAKSDQCKVVQDLCT
jgi:hypothetical protein